MKIHKKMKSRGMSPPREKFHGKDVRGCKMRKRCADGFGEFQMGHPFAFSRWHGRRHMWPGDRHFRRHTREHKHLKEKRQKKRTNREVNDDAASRKECSVNKRCRSVFRNLDDNEVAPFFDKFSSLLKISHEKGFFEVIVNVRGCDPDNVKVNIKNNILKVEGRSEAPDGAFTSVVHSQSLPKEVLASNLKASLYPEGILIVHQEESGLNIPIHTEESIEDDGPNIEIVQL